MVFKCDDCGRTFDEPARKEYMENLDGENGWMQCVDTFCPFCGCETFEPVEDDWEEVVEDAEE